MSGEFILASAADLLPVVAAGARLVGAVTAEALPLTMVATDVVARYDQNWFNKASTYSIQGVAGSLRCWKLGILEEQWRIAKSTYNSQ